MSSTMQSYIWASSIPLYIAHESSSIPYRLLVPRLSYLPFLLPRLSLFFGRAVSSFYHQGTLLTNLPVGLLCDIYQPALPWKLRVGDGPLYEMHDTFINSVKEADFVRNGTAKGIMSLSKDHSTQLWQAVQDSKSRLRRVRRCAPARPSADQLPDDLRAFLAINHILLNPPTPLRQIPLRLYLPAPPAVAGLSAASFKTVQIPVPPQKAPHRAHTIGSALNAMLPALFPNPGEAIIAQPVLHGSRVPLHTPLEELMREAAYADGWLHVCVRMMDG